MKKILGALSVQCLVSAFALSASPVHASPVSCATPDMWTGAARMTPASSHGLVRAVNYREVTSDAPAQNESWDAVYRGAALGQSRGAVRARLQRQGGLWVAKTGDVGISQAAALAAFRQMYVWARAAPNGAVVLRAKEGDRTATRALQIARGRQPLRSPAVILQQEPRSLGIDVAIMRLEGRYSRDAVQFVEALSSGMDIYPFGTSFVVKVPVSLAPVMWDAIDGEGSRVFLVGASGPAMVGSQVSHATKLCGAAALTQRFPMPAVSTVMSNGAIVEVESQHFSVNAGDVILTVQNPPYGRGIEVGLARFSRR